MHKLFYCLLVLFPFSIFSQKLQKIKFIVWHPIILDSSVGSYINKEFEFEYSRVILKDSSFKESNLFVRLSLCCDTDTFKIKNKVWFIKVKGKWLYFFNNGKQVKSRVIIGGKQYKIMWGSIKYINNKKVFVLKFFPVGFTVSANPVYYFHPELGVIIIQGHDADLIRKDFVALPN